MLAPAHVLNHAGYSWTLSTQGYKATNFGLLSGNADWQLDATGAELTVTSCANCRQTFDDGQAHFKWDRTMGSLLELVAGNLQASRTDTWVRWKL